MTEETIPQEGATGEPPPVEEEEGKFEAPTSNDVGDQTLTQADTEEEEEEEEEETE